ncbi:MAG: hypothetical protein DKT66_25130 [Candidatus Melainabacteria bacterium]|nr:MAG: hypothetical protein DKT66_25130 [Candidatus Melainabacteria bacterium]
MAIAGCVSPKVRISRWAIAGYFSSVLAFVVAPAPGAEPGLPAGALLISGAGAGSAIFGTCGFNKGVAEDAPEAGDAAPGACAGRGADLTGALAEPPVDFVAEGLELKGVKLDAPAAGWAETGGFETDPTGGFDPVSTSDLDGAVPGDFDVASIEGFAGASI